MNGFSDPRLIKGFKVFTVLGSLLSIATGFLGWEGWVLDFSYLSSWAFAPVRIAANAAVCFVLLGIALWLQKDKDRQAFAMARKFTARTAACLVCVVALLSFVEHIFRLDFGIDYLLVLGSLAEHGTVHRQNLMAPVTAVNFLLLGLALLLLDWKPRQKAWPAQYLCFGAATSAIFGLFSLLMEPREAGITMALPTAVNFFVLSFAVVFSRAEWAVRGLLTSKSTGARLLRRTSPVTFVFLSLILWSISKTLITEGQLSWPVASVLAILCGLVVIGFITWTSFIVERRDVQSTLLEELVAKRTTALAESESRLAGIIQTALDAIVTVDEQQNIVLFNAAAERIFRCQASDVLGRPLSRMLPQIFQDAHGEHLCKFGKTGVTKGLIGCAGVLRAVRADGEEFLAEASISQIEAVGKKNPIVILMLRDVTERKRAEEALRASEEANRITFERAAVGIAEVGLDGTWLRVNDKLCAITGYTREELVGMKVQDITHPDDLSTSLEVMRRTLACEIQSHFWEKRYIRKDRTVVWVDLTVSLVRAASGEPRHFITIAEDSTARKLAEVEVLRMNRALRVLSGVNQLLAGMYAEDELLRKAVNIFAEVGGYPLAWIGTAAHNPEFSIRVAACAGTASKFVREATRSCGKHKLSSLSPTGIALHEGVTSVIQDSSYEASATPWRELAKEYGLQSNLTMPLLIQGQPVAALMVYASEKNAFGEEEINLIKELTGNLAMGIAAARDRKEARAERDLRKQVEAELIQSQKLEAVGQLAGGIAHDFNNLLMVIMAQTELLEQKLEGSALQRAESVMQSAERAAELTRQLLAFSRKQPSQPKVTTMSQLVSGVSDMLQRLVGENIEVKITSQDTPWPVKADRSQFEQVIMNLVVNARDAMPDGGRLTLETKNAAVGMENLAPHPLLPPGDYAVLAVTDTGTGMSAEVQARLFEPFFTTKEPGKGTGLGLSMVYGIVKKSEGFICVDSEQGRGTRFTIYLPKAELSGVAKFEEHASPTETSARHATILLVEDEEVLRSVIAEFLRLGGHKVFAADSMVEASRVALERRTEIDLLLTDVLLKDGNADQLVQLLKQQGCVFWVLYMSGYAPNTIGHNGVLAPGTLFLQKPFSRTALLDKINEALCSRA